MTEAQFPAGAIMGFFSLHYYIQNGYGTCPASYPMGTKGSYPRGKAARTPLTSI